MTEREMKEGRVKAFRMMQIFGSGSTLVCAVLLYFFMPDKDLGLIIALILCAVAAGEFFIFRAMADKAEAEL
ncbi:hypothetical protein [Fretibacter rubidus]|uniref:hypothetical protein n=1 Tax=Fretibacter rubidus TaxID=570162 RepID=UPI00352B6503